ncbi:cell adhesion molecule CEACAM5-like [Sarcophilus harrisii]
MKLSMKNQTLTILSVKREDAGSYECEIWNPIDFNRSDPITVTVNYGPDNIMFVPNPEKGEIEVIFNDPLMLECYVESYPPAQYRWQVNGTMNSAFSNIYVIKNATWEDSGKYICQAKNNVTNLSVSKSITVKVVERTTKPNLTVNGTNVIENDTLAFTCGTEQAGVDILWFFNNMSLILNERMKLSMHNQTLTILSVKREDIGFYECEIRNPISSNRSDPITLTVNYGPDYITFVPNSEQGEIEVKFKDSLTLECHVESYPPAQYRWQVNGTKIPDFSNNTYVIKNATWEDSGKYTCQAKNNVTNLSVSKSITVKVVERTTKPNLTVNRTSVIENDTLDFTCGTEQAGGNILWFFNNISLILNEKMKLSMNNQTLTILSVKRKGAGSYQCEIRNSISSNRSDPIILVVNCE